MEGYLRARVRAANGMSKTSKEEEIRGTAKMRFLGTLVGWIVRVAGWTIRVRFVDRTGRIDVLMASDQPIIYALWHNAVLGFMQATVRKKLKRERVVLTSASKDGAALAALVGVFGYGAVRGSTSRRGRAAMLGLLRAVKEGKDVGITPDGPRGPRYVVQPGVIKLAQATGAPILPMSMECRWAWRLKTWDHFRIPLPFSKVVITIHELLEVPRQIGEDASEELRRRLESLLREGLDDLEPGNNHEH